jgi:hypothetical protein
MQYDKGRHTLAVRGEGAYVILGVVPQTVKLQKRGRAAEGGKTDFPKVAWASRHPLNECMGETPMPLNVAQRRPLQAPRRCLQRRGR